ncbi:SRPBCC family protein [Rhizobium sp. YIM 134829]|uniref:SRPBCC family protein n=1 Tax=Rhizobium sp. YIM 134829 TaxID=3390453 RepID=UPI00397A192C
MTSLSTPLLQSIEIDELLPHARHVVWRALTEADLMRRWMMTPEGFRPVVGTRFTFRTKPAGAWDGTIHCEVLDVIDQERIAYRWTGGHESNIGYGSKLDTVVSITLSDAPNGTRLSIVHSGFELPRNDSAFRTMSDGWKVVAERLETVVAEEASSANAASER